MSDPTTDLARNRIRQVFKFLEAFNARRNPVATQIGEQPHVLFRRNIDIVHGNLTLAELADPDPSVEESEGSGDVVLRVRRVEIEAPPPPPDDVATLLQDGWEDPESEPRLLADPLAVEVNQPVDWLTVREVFNNWLPTWRTWASGAIQAYRVNAVFNYLFDVRSEMEREAERFEFVAGDGILNWRLDSGGVNFPLLMQRLQIDYDAAIPEFRVSESERPPELNASLLRRAGVDGRTVSELISRCQSELASPFGADWTSTFLRSVAATIAPDGHYLDERGSGEFKHPRIWRDQVFFIRNRAQGYEAAIANILEDLEERESFPESLRAICGVHSQLGDVDEVDLSAGYADEVDDVLLSKEANSEQLEIARRLGRFGAVRVQGPPGTGKTHTIANLIGHLLAQGRSVLVTSHTTKALRVLREKIADQLQPLCVSVLEGDAESRAQLADSVTRIGDRLGSTTRDELLRQAAQLQNHRESCLETVRGLRSRLLAAVSADYAEITAAGRSWTTEQAGKHVAAGTGIHDWIPGSIEGRLPLSPMEVEALYRTNAQLSPDEERWVAGSLPELDSMMPPEVLEREIAELRERGPSSDLDFGSELWVDRAGSVSELLSLADDIETALRAASSRADSQFAAIAAGAASAEEQRPWRELASLLEEASKASGERRRAVMTSDPKLPSELRPEDALRALREMQAHVERGGSFGWLTLKTHGAWNKILADASCIGAPPWTGEALRALASIPAAQLSWERVKARWPLVMEPFGEALPGSETQADEAACLQIARQLLEAVELPRAVIAPLASRAHELGLDWGRFAPETEIDLPNASEWRALIERIASTAPQALRAEAARRERDACLDRLDYATHRLRQEPLTLQSGSPAERLLSALQAYDSEAYARAYADLIALHESKAALSKRLEFLTRLERQAPDWAAALRHRVPPHDRDSTLGDVQTAWDWRLVRQELVARSTEDVDDLIRAIEAAKQDLRFTTIQLIDRLAWAGQISRTTPEAKQALQIWLNTVKKIGKGTGRNVPLLRRAAQESMATARDAVPVWIAPLSRVAESFDARTTRFDVVIVDEASQSDVLGLIALYLGAQIIVVGDDQQVTPAAVGERLDTANQLIASYLQGIPGSHLYDGTYSIYEIAGTAFSGVTQLREHFRCVPDIIRFSNALSYDWRIIPLRDPSSAKVKPPVVYEHVSSAESDERVNREEALHVASLVLAAAEQPEYSGLTFGIISMLGAEQSRQVEILLRNNMRLDEYERRRILCGAPPQFQGDERDVIFMTLVDAPSPDGGPLPRRGDPGDLWKKRYNVAVSRAKDQLWVVTSLDSSRDLQTDDLRWRLIEFAKNPSGLQSRIAQAQARAESPLESEVISRLVTAGYRVTPQVVVGAYRIDLVVSDGKRKLAVECDGDRYHTQENLQSDLERQAQLERMGWRFVRIRGSEFFRDPGRTMESVFKRLSELGIQTGTDREEGGGPGDSDEIIARIRARAAEWKQELRESRTPRSTRARRGRRFGSGLELAEESASSSETPNTTLPDSVVAAPHVIVADAAPRQRPLPLAVSGIGRVVSVSVGGGALAELRPVLEAGGFRVEDLRTKGGSFWVYDREKQLSDFMRELRSRGLRFQYSDRRAGWFCK